MALNSGVKELQNVNNVKIERQLNPLRPPVNVYFAKGYLVIRVFGNAGGGASSSS